MATIISSAINISGYKGFFYYPLLFVCFGIGKQSYGDVLPHHVLSVSSGRLRGTEILFFLTP
jgi:hypothetical protein